MLLNHEYDRKIRVGYIGSGEMSFRNILPCFHYTPIDLVAMADHNTDRGLAVARQFGARGLCGRQRRRGLRHSGSCRSHCLWGRLDRLYGGLDHGLGCHHNWCAGLLTGVSPRGRSPLTAAHAHQHTQDQYSNDVRPTHRRTTKSSRMAMFFPASPRRRRPHTEQ